MKKVWSILCACAMIIGMLPMMTLPASAEYISDDFDYTVLEDGTAEITDYAGSATNLTIPSKLGGYTVTSIGYYAFENCTSLQSITIPNSVTSIGIQAFYGCASLKSITVGNGVTVIGEEAFTGTAYYNNLANWTNGVLYIGKYLIEAKQALSGAHTVRTGTTVIAEKAFYKCESLQNITIPNGVMSIEDQTFYKCTSLKSITIPGSVKSIGEYAFWNCSSLTSATILNGVKSIGGSAFEDCTSLESVTIPGSVTSIGGSAFYDCASLTSVTISNGVKSIGGSAFSRCTSLKSIAIPNSVMSIGGYAFSSCSSLRSITIPNDVTSIGSGTFTYCTSLKSITIPNSVKIIGNYAFDDCSSLTNVYYGGSQTQWANVEFGYGNDALAMATVHYNAFASITAQSATTAYASKNKVASVKVTAKGPGLSYTWYIKNPGATKYVKSSVKSATYSAKMTPTNSGRYVYCIVKDKYGNQVKSKTFVLRMKATITSQSATAGYAKKGATASVKVSAVGTGLKYTWYTKNAGASKYVKSSVTSATYKATMNSTAKGRLLYCVVKDKYGKTAKSKTFILREAVSITTQPKSSATAKGAIAKATVKASGDGLKYTWYIKNAGQTKYTKSSVTKATYTATMNSKAKNRLVYCVVKDKYGKTVKSNTVQLKMK